MHDDGSGVAMLPLVHHVVHALALAIDTTFDGQLTQAEALILFLLASSDKLTMSDLHRAFGHRRSTLTSVVDRLVSRSYAQREVPAHNRRSLVVRLTPAGRTVAREVSQLFHTIETAGMRGLSTAARSAAQQILSGMIAAATQPESTT